MPSFDHTVEALIFGPILNFSCSYDVKLSGQLKTLYFNSSEKPQEWTVIADYLDMLVVLKDGIMMFWVKNFCP